MPCKFCYGDEPCCFSEKLVLCSRCFQVLARSSQEQIEQAYRTALEKGCRGKADVLEKFILTGNIEEGGTQINVKRTSRHIAKHFDRRRVIKADRLDKITACRLQKRQKASVSENQQELSAVPGA